MLFWHNSVYKKQKNTHVQGDSNSAFFYVRLSWWKLCQHMLCSPPKQITDEVDVIRLHSRSCQADCRYIPQKTLSKLSETGGSYNHVSAGNGSEQDGCEQITEKHVVEKHTPINITFFFLTERNAQVIS